MRTDQPSSSESAPPAAAQDAVDREWYRVAELKPRLRSHARVHRHVYRGDVWFVLQDPTTGRFNRFTPLANECIGLMDGTHTLEEIHQQLGERVSQGRLIELLSRLHLADLLQPGVVIDADELVSRAEKQERRVRYQRWRTPLAIRLRLWDPDQFLNVLQPLARALFSVWGGVAWLLLVGSALLVAALHWGPLTENVADRVFGVENLLLLALVFPLVKAFHELGHGLAVKARDGDVHEMGLMFLVLVPVPYVEASASTSFANKYHRMLVGAGGMLAELGIAALALHIWVLLEPGLFRALCFNAIVIASVSTLIFNGNPLLRFDAYYILMDAIEIPNLASRANRYLFYLLQRYVYGAANVASPVTAAGESPWFVGYGIAAFCYRMVITFTIATLVASQYFVIGIILAAWALTGMVLWPLLRGIGYLFRSRTLAGHRSRALVATAALLLAIAALIGAIPVAHRTVVQGVVYAPSESWIRVEQEGFVSSLLSGDGAEVSEGTPLLRLTNTQLQLEAELLRAQVEELTLRKRAVETVDRVLALSIAKELDYSRQRLTQAQRHLDELTMTASHGGRVAWLFPESDLPGRYLQRGDAVGFLLPEQGIAIRALVAQDVADLVRNSPGRTQVRIIGDLDQIYPAILVREVPAATRELPSLALGSSGGGDIATVSEGNTMRTFNSVFDFELKVEDVRHPPRLGARVYVRFDHGAEPLVYRWYRSGRQLLLSQFSV